MITNIQKIRGFGIFQDYLNSETHDFGKYNLLYGWNGSGKSTLARLLRCLETKMLPKNFADSNFYINIQGSSQITHVNFGSSNLNVQTFNQDFVDENISWNNVVKSILLIDKKKIAERELLESLRKEQQTTVESFKKLEQDISSKEMQISKFATDGAKLIKTSLQSIDTGDRYYLNYDKRKFEAFISAKELKINASESILGSKEIVDITNAAKPDQRAPVVFSGQTQNLEQFKKAKEALSEIMSASIVSQAIQRLIENPDIKNWVESGLGLHKHHAVDKCEFCGGFISEDRVAQLEAHFNDNYKKLMERLQKADQWINSQYIPPLMLASVSDFYEEFKSVYGAACSSLDEAREKINQSIRVWQEILREKKEQPLNINFSIPDISFEAIEQFNGAIDAIAKAVREHNHKTANFQQETKKAKQRLELHYAISEAQSFDYHTKVNDLKTKKAQYSIIKADIERRRNQIYSIEESLANEGIGAEEFNKSLCKFLGRSEISLRFNALKKGYEIIRNGADLCDGNLSEGEKTAIAFVYFITKLKENGNKIEETIVVVDDPVSSFDSNHLFHSYSFLRNNCKEPKQLFVFTHNFTFFKLMRDWFEGINKNRKIKGKPSNAQFFTIEPQQTNPRVSRIRNADASLIQYNSEYHYIFSKLHQYKDYRSLSRDDAFIAANLARKLLESFFSFKYPKHRSDVSQLLNCGINGCKRTDETTKEKIYRFINKYSHSVSIDVNEDSSENLIGESQNVIGDIFVWLEEVDSVHYNEMVDVVTA